jgi:alcohol dehydrogenase (cytochrome c)
MSLRVAAGAVSLFAISGGAGVLLAQARPAIHQAAPEEKSIVFGPGDTEWRFYNNNADGRRYTELDQINTATIGKMTELCRVRVGGPGPFSSGILMVEGRLYVTTRLSTVALDATNCDVLWKSNYVPEQTEVFNTHRGVAYADGVIVRGTTDGRMVAYDAVSGQEKWRTKAADPTVGEFFSSAPIAWDGKVFEGVAGGDWGIQGRVMAFDLKTGEKLWSFNTIPGPGEFGNESWPGDSWKHGGGGTWTSYTLDPETGELFVPVANPAMSFVGDARKGDNLFSNSVLVLDARTGKYRWHYQTRQHDTHDMGVTSPPILVTLKDGRKVVAVTPKDGYLYLIDRKTHKLIYRVAATTIANHEVPPTVEGVRYCPGIYGGSEWSSPAFDPVNQTLTTGQTDWCVTIRRMDPLPGYNPGSLYMGGKHVMDKDSGGWVAAFDAKTGKPRWKHKTPAPVVSGVTPTSGGLTFVGDMGGTFYAFRSSDGELLRTWNTGGAIAGGVISYKAGGRQYVAITSGNISRSSWPQASGIPSVVIYGVPQDKAAGAPAIGDAGKGRTLYGATCVGCHGAEGKGGGGGPVLTGVSTRYSYAGLVDYIKYPRAPMPALYPSVISEQDVADVTAYVETLK